MNRTLTFIAKFTEGKIEKIVDPLSYDDEVEEIIKAYDEIELKRATRLILALSKKGNQYFQEQEPWQTIKTDKARTLNSLAVLANLIKDLSILIYPIIPKAAESIQEQLGMTKDFTLAALKKPLHDHQIGTPVVLFKKLEDDQVKYLKEKYSGRQEGYEHLVKEVKVKEQKPKESKQKEQKVKEAVEPKSHEPKKQKEGKNTEPAKQFSQEEIDAILKKIDLRVAKIIGVEKHPKADKLYIEKLDVGNGEERTIVSGLVPYYTSDELLGKNIIIVYNLKSAELRGVLSKGMLLAASEDGKVGILNCPEMEPGDRITFDGIDSNPTDEITVDEFFGVTTEAKAGKVYIDGHEFIGNVVVDKNLQGKVK